MRLFPMAVIRKRALICLIVLGVGALPAAAQDRTLIVNKTKESIWYAKAVWVWGTNDSGLAFEPTNYYHVWGWYEIKAGEKASVDWLPYLRIEKDGKPVVLPGRDSNEMSFPMTREDGFGPLRLDEKEAYTKDDVPKGYVLGRGFYKYRKGVVATVYPDSKTLDEGDSKVNVGSGAQQVQGSAGEFKEGDVVWAEWTINDWYHGKIARKTASGYEIKFDDGDTATVAGSKIAPDRAPKGDLLKGTRVLAKWSDDKFYPGKVADRKADGSYAVDFDDGSKGPAKLSDLRFIGR
jgi:hypothetical protein